MTSNTAWEITGSSRAAFFTSLASGGPLVAVRHFDDHVLVHRTVAGQFLEVLPLIRQPLEHGPHRPVPNFNKRDAKDLNVLGRPTLSGPGNIQPVSTRGYRSVDVQAVSTTSPNLATRNDKIVSASTFAGHASISESPAGSAVLARSGITLTSKRIA